jgi:hypothetical protein
MGPLYTTAANGYVSVTKQLIEARCNFDLQENNFTARQGHVTVTKQLLPAHLTSIFRQRMGAHVTPSFNQLFVTAACPPWAVMKSSVVPFSPGQEPLTLSRTQINS